MIQKSKWTNLSVPIKKVSPGRKTSLTRDFKEGVGEVVRYGCQQYNLMSNEEKYLISQKSDC